MEKIRGKRITSYCIFVFMILLIVVVLIPQNAFLSNQKAKDTIRLMQRRPKQEEKQKEETGSNSFAECRIFGIKKLINDYYDAYIMPDDKMILKYMDTFGDMDQGVRKFSQENVEQYMDISCYSMEGSVEGSYLVISYGYAKYYGINTTVPVVGTFFIRTNSSGSYYICNSVVSNESSAYNEIMFEGKQVQEMKEVAQYELDTACEVDLILKQFVENNPEYFKY